MNRYFEEIKHDYYPGFLVTMRHVIFNPDWPLSRQEIKKETIDQEIARVDFVLSKLKDIGIIGDTRYDLELFSEFRKLVHKTFFVFWTAIYPPMERLLYALSYIIRPRSLLGLGIFTGNPVVWSMGPGLQGVYKPKQFVAVEIDENNARLCQDNFSELQGELQADMRVDVLPEDGFKTLTRYKNNSIDLLYLDASGRDPETGLNGKRINYSFLKNGYSKLKRGAFVLCHNAAMESFKKEAADYLSLTSDDAIFECTATIHIDEMGLEITKKNNEHFSSRQDGC
ncbi:MAG: hypothetical protein ACTSWN_03190 [Promethearchaeota archaeon]